MRKSVIALLAALLVVSTVSPAAADETNGGDSCPGLLGCDPSVLPPDPTPEPTPTPSPTPSPTASDGSRTLEQRPNFSYTLSTPTPSPALVGQTVSFSMQVSVRAEEPNHMFNYQVRATNGLDKVLVSAGAFPTELVSLDFSFVPRTGGNWTIEVAGGDGEPVSFVVFEFTSIAFTGEPSTQTPLPLGVNINGRFPLDSDVELSVTPATSAAGQPFSITASNVSPGRNSAVVFPPMESFGYVKGDVVNVNLTQDPSISPVALIVGSEGSLETTSYQITGPVRSVANQQWKGEYSILHAPRDFSYDAMLEGRAAGEREVETTIEASSDAPRSFALAFPTAGVWTVDNPDIDGADDTVFVVSEQWNERLTAVPDVLGAAFDAYAQARDARDSVQADGVSYQQALMAVASMQSALSVVRADRATLDATLTWMQANPEAAPSPIRETDIDTVSAARDTVRSYVDDIEGGWLPEAVGVRDALRPNDPTPNPTPVPTPVNPIVAVDARGNGFIDPVADDGSRTGRIPVKVAVQLRFPFKSGTLRYENPPRINTKRVDDAAVYLIQNPDAVMVTHGSIARQKRKPSVVDVRRAMKVRSAIVAAASAMGYDVGQRVFATGVGVNPLAKSELQRRSVDVLGYME